MPKEIANCRHCGHEFTYYACHQPGYYCSHVCHDNARRESLETRFWKHVQKTDGCWQWTASLSRGYGRMRLNDKKRSRIMSHRFSWELHNGPVPEGILVLHHCDNRCCVRPDHLFLGTHSDNARDSVMKGRNYKGTRYSAKGEAHPMAKLTEQQVYAIRQEYEKGPSSQQAIAAQYNVTKTTIGQIVRRDTWKHI